MPTKANWLLALVLAALLAPHASIAAESSGGGSIEVGGYTQDIDKNGARVNEYSRLETSKNGAAYGLVDLHGASGNSAGELSVDLLGKETPEGKLNLDFGRIFRLSGENSEFRHQLDHDRIDYLNAAVPGGDKFAPGNTAAGPKIPLTDNSDPLAPIAIGTGWNLGTSPDAALNPNNVPGFIGLGDDKNWYAFNPDAKYTGAPPQTIGTATAVKWQQIGRASVYGEDFAAGQVFEITRKEAKAESDLILPFLPNITFHAGVRVEERDGTEQAIGMSKCTACHVTGSSRKVDEKTEEFTLGATGRFGLLTVDYGFKTSDFEERAAAPTRVYDPALSPSPSTTYNPVNGTFDNRLLYDYEPYGVAGEGLSYDQTPDSEKKSHVVKARMDFSHNANLVGSFVNSTVESKKTDEPGIWNLGDKTLTSDYDGYGIRLTTKLSDTVRLNLRGKLENIEADDSIIVYEPMGTSTVKQKNLDPNATTDPATSPKLPPTIARTYESVESRDVLTVGTDIFWRLARKSSLRLGYEFKTDDRDSEHYGKTTKQTAEATYRRTLAKGLTFRVGYTFQAIDDPFMHENAAGYIDSTTGQHYTNDLSPNTIGTGPLYGTAFYDQRQTDLSNQPETVHEGKVSSTWSPAANFSTTLALRYRDEGNDLDRSEWTQQTVSPSLSFWYAPAQKLNLTFAYNYLGQKAESRFCQGWYDG